MNMKLVSKKLNRSATAPLLAVMPFVPVLILTHVSALKAEAAKLSERTRSMIKQPNMTFLRMQKYLRPAG